MVNRDNVAGTTSEPIQTFRKEFKPDFLALRLLLVSLISKSTNLTKLEHSNIWSSHMHAGAEVLGYAACFSKHLNWLHDSRGNLQRVEYFVLPPLCLPLP